MLGYINLPQTSLVFTKNVLVKYISASRKFKELNMIKKKRNLTLKSDQENYFLVRYIRSTCR